MVKHNLEDVQLITEDTEDHGEWRRRARLADPSPEEYTA